MHPDLERAIDSFVEVYKYTGIHASKPHEQEKLVELKDELFDGITTIALTKAEELATNLEEATLATVAIGNELAKECADRFNAAKIPFYQPFEITPSGPPVELDPRFFLICMTQLPPEQLRPYIPVLEDFFILDRLEHPDYIGPDIDAIIYHLRKTREPIPDEDVVALPAMEDIASKDILKEYFKTFKTLKTYISNGKYDDPNGKLLYDRMNLLQHRLASDT